MVSAARRGYIRFALPLLVTSVSFLPLAGASSNVGAVGSDLDLLADSILAARAASTSTPPTAPLLLKYQKNDRSLLPVQICGIVGAYFLTVVALGVCLLTFGRRMRRDAQYGSGQAEVEMVKSPPRQHDPSPPSPASTSRGWMKRAFHRDRKVGATTAGNISAPVSPGMPAHQSFDQRIVEGNREQQQKDLEMLYQAVMEQDARKSSTNVTTTAVGDEADEVPEQPFSPVSPQFPASPLSPPPQQLQPSTEYNLQGKPVDRRLLRIQTGREAPVPSDMKSPLSPHSPANPLSPRSPVTAIYPPDSPASHVPQTPYSPRHGRPTPPTPGQGLPASPRSFVSRSSRGESILSANTLATNKNESKTRKALRNLRISSPIQHVGDEEEREPLSPRYYGEPGPAPNPPTPYTGKSFNSVTTTRTFITSDSDEEEEYARTQQEALDRPAPLPRPAPQRGTSHPSNIDLRTQASNRSMATDASDPSLPFRNLHPDAAVPPTPVKTTVLERKIKPSMRGPRTAGLTPMTGTVPMTPYSPYMPFTPVTPVTPHLLNKKEMKVRKKEERRRVMAKDEGDLVERDEEMWGDAY